MCGDLSGRLPRRLVLRLLAMTALNGSRFFSPNDINLIQIRPALPPALSDFYSYSRQMAIATGRRIKKARAINPDPIQNCGPELRFQTVAIPATAKTAAATAAIFNFILLPFFHLDDFIGHVKDTLRSRLRHQRRSGSPWQLGSCRLGGPTTPVPLAGRNPRSSHLHSAVRPQPE